MPEAELSKTASLWDLRAWSLEYKISVSACWKAGRSSERSFLLTNGYDSITIL